MTLRFRAPASPAGHDPWTSAALTPANPPAKINATPSCVATTAVPDLAFGLTLSAVGGGLHLGLGHLDRPLFLGLVAGGIPGALDLFQLLGKRPESFDFRLGASLLGLDSFKLLGKLSQHLGGPLGQNVLLDLFLL